MRRRCCCDDGCDLAASFTSACGASFTVVFTDTSSSSVSITSWSWDFGDGGTSTAQNPTHKFMSAGPHTVTVEVTDANGCVETATGEVTCPSASCARCTSTIPTSFTVTLPGNGTSARGCSHCTSSVAGAYILTTTTTAFGLSCGRFYTETVGTGTLTGCTVCTSHPGRTTFFEVYGGMALVSGNTVLRVVISYGISATGSETGCASGAATFEKNLGTSPQSCAGVHDLDLVSTSGTALCDYGFTQVTLSI